MRNTRWRQWLRRNPINHPASARRRTTRRPLTTDSAAEVLESRVLLTPTPFLAFAVQPDNTTAGHALTLTVDVMINRSDSRIPPVVDTAFSGDLFVTPNGPGGWFSPINSTHLPPNVQITGEFSSINNGIGKLPADFLSLDVAGTYTVSATAPTVPEFGVTGVPGNAVSGKFTVSPDKSTDHLVFVNQLFPFVGVPTNVSVAVEDQFGNIDTSVSNVPLTLQVVPGTTAKATLTNGRATFHDVTFAGGGEDVELAYGVGGPNGFLFGADTVPVVTLPLES